MFLHSVRFYWEKCCCRYALYSKSLSMTVQSTHCTVCGVWHSADLVRQSFNSCWVLQELLSSIVMAIVNCPMQRCPALQESVGDWLVHCKVSSPRLQTTLEQSSNCICHTLCNKCMRLMQTARLPAIFTTHPSALLHLAPSPLLHELVAAPAFCDIGIQLGSQCQV